MATSTFSERRWLSRDGLSLYARDYPPVGETAGFPVICLHGLTRNSADFEEIAPLIASWGRRVLVPDVRGRGRSDPDPNPKNYQPRTYARDVIEMMAALGIGRAIFIGTSMGGIIIMTLVGIRPKAVAEAVLNDVGPQIAPEGIARILGYAGKSAEIRSWDDAAEYIRRANEVAYPEPGQVDWQVLARRMFRETAHGPVLDYDPAIGLNLAKPVSRLSRWLVSLLFKRLARSRPTMLIRGAISDIIDEKIAARMERAAPRMQRVDIAGVGHAPQLSEPAAVDAIKQFLRTVDLAQHGQ